MKSKFKEIINNPDVDGFDIGWTKPNTFSVLIKMYDQKVANIYWFNSLEEIETWMEEEVTVSAPIPSVKKTEPKLPMPLMPMPGL